MPASLPNFNLLADVWVPPSNPDLAAPNFEDVPVQVYIHSKADIDQIYPDEDNWYPPIYLRVPIGGYRPQISDIIQVKHLPLDYYIVTWTQNIHMGFPNEYVMACVKQCTVGGIVTPR
jgi:hypothetical protein